MSLKKSFNRKINYRFIVGFICVSLYLLLSYLQINVVKADNKEPINVVEFGATQNISQEAIQKSE
ncbi:MAG: putative secreted protein [Candidatus Phytoplasma asteris]|uniref:Predicted hydrolase of the HD superfamily n=1 Tax='Chrysanthemum coronarium' phytoplasma TaxID=1520703 RepID=A0ABQ0J200_9MOLU|nr:hypothetical protein ['Chrysanthemum coronarium' phytoplasma]TKA88246.1 MAG: putative secreted protein [Periwinkle leaf yellowing phytoplasma]WEX19345.1 MAG: putative secreted protein [Candidatus Phytoplasma asteris]GAK73635.1 predicted hydrolase of the HD superfamily ['Chrysanthemum coronarium' phytoplasma]